MMDKLVAFLIGTLLLGAPGLANAKGPGEVRDRAQLEKRLAQHERQQAHVANKLGAQDQKRLNRHRAQVQKLIDRMEAGQAVSPAEIDQAFELPAE